MKYFRLLFSFTVEHSDGRCHVTNIPGGHLKDGEIMKTCQKGDTPLKITIKMELLTPVANRDGKSSS